MSPDDLDRPWHYHLRDTDVLASLGLALLMAGAAAGLLAAQELSVLGGAFLGAVVSLGFGILFIVFDRNREDRRQADLLAENDKLRAIMLENVLPRFRTAVELGDSLVLALPHIHEPQAWPDSEPYDEFVRCADKLGIRSEAEQLAQDKPMPAEASARVYEALTGVAGKEVLAGYHLSYYLGWMSGLVLQDGFEGNAHLADFSDDLMADLGQLDTFELAGIDQRFRDYVRRCLDNWANGKANGQAAFLFFRHLFAVLRTLGRGEPEAEHLREMFSDLASHGILLGDAGFLPIAEKVALDFESEDRIRFAD
jgi:hypothetical protein